MQGISGIRCFGLGGLVIEREVRYNQSKGNHNVVVLEGVNNER
jgi:hypothetical protein